MIAKTKHAIGITTKNGKDPTVIVVLTQPDKILNNKTYNVTNRNTPIGKVGNAAN